MRRRRETAIRLFPEGEEPVRTFAWRGKWWLFEHETNHGIAGVECHYVEATERECRDAEARFAALYGG